MAKTFEELLVVANKIRTNELPESNTHALVGEHLVELINKMINMRETIQGDTTETIKTLLDYVLRTIGDLSNLETENKANVVGAINELNDIKANSTDLSDLADIVMDIADIIGDPELLETNSKEIVGALNEIKSVLDLLNTAVAAIEIANLSEIDDFAPAEGHRFYALNLAGTETAYLMQTVYNGIATQMLWTSRVIEGNAFTSKQSDEGMCVYTRIRKEDGWGEWNEAGGSGSGAGNVFNVDKFIPLSDGSYNLMSAISAVMNYKNGKFMAVGLIITYRDATGSFKSWQFNGETVNQFDVVELWNVFGGEDRVKRIFVNGEEKQNVNGTVDINLPIPEVDEFLDEQSTNTIQNKVVAKKFDSLGDNMLKDVDIIPDEANAIVTLNFMNTKDQLITSVDIPAIGGGGGGDGSAVTRISISAKLAEDEMKKGESNLLTYSYAHTYVGGEEDGQPTGTRATITIQVKSGIEVLAEYTENNVAQGNYTYDLPVDLPAGVIDVYVIATAKDPINTDKTQKRTAYASTRVYDLSLKSSFDLRTNFITALNANGIVTIPFAITGAGSKAIKLHLDGNGNAYASQTITDSGTTNSSFQVNLGDSKLQSGRHNIQIIAEITTSTGKVIKSNLLYIDLYKPYASSVTTKKPFVGIKHSFNRDMFVSYEYQNPVFDFKQYEETAIEYVVYKEDSPTVSLTIKENGNVVQSSVAAREVYTYLNRYTSTGTFNNIISAGSGNVITEYEYQVIIGKSDVNIEEVTDSMVLKLIAAGRSNNESESVRNKWSYGDITTEFFGFDWKLNGWMNNQLVMNNGASININYKPFTTEALATGKTLEFEIITSNIFDKDALILSCMQQSGNNLIGFDMTTREARLITKGGSIIATKFAPDMKLRISFVIESKEQNRMLMLYVNGICCGAIRYAESDSLMQDSPSLPISINSLPCDVSISCVRAYNRALNADELLRNYIADRTNTTEMSSLFKRNDILDETGEAIDMTKLVSHGKSVVLLTADIEWLAANNSKKTIIPCDYTLWDHKGDVLTVEGGGVSNQGTSSMLYPVKNLRLYHNTYANTLVYLNGEAVPNKGYAINKNSRPVGLFCMKADYADSSGTHNTGVAKILNDTWVNCGFLTPPQKANKEEYDVRTAVDGFPVTVFFRKDASSAPKFIGHYNFNNDKAESEIVYGFEGIKGYNDEEALAGTDNPCICLEILNNTGDIANFRTNDLSKFDDDLEFRYPDGPKYADATEAQITKIKSLWDFVVSCKDKPAKFKDEYQNYFDKNSLLGWYIYTEYFMALDQRAKNVMLATWGDKWYFIPYDNDTVLGVHNKGELVYDYDIDETSLDPLGGEDNLIYAYMGHDSVLWNLIRSKEMYDDLASVAKKIRDKMTTPYVLKVLNEIQMAEWSERVYNKDSEFKYIIPAIEGRPNLQGEMIKYNYVCNLQGSRYAHRTYLVRNRFALMDSKYVAGEFAGDEVGYRLHNDFATNPGRIWLKPTERFFFAHGINSNVVEGALLPGEDGRVTMKLTSAYTQNDPAKIFGASKILELDLSNVAKYLISGINFNKCKNMTVLKMSSVNDTESVYNTGLNTINMSGCINLHEMYMDGMMNTSLKTLDLSDCRKLTTLVAGTTNLTSIQFADGINPSHIVLPASLQALEFKSSKVTLGNLRFYEGDEGWSNLERVVFDACPNMDWVEAVGKCTNLKFIRVTGVSAYGNGDVLIDIMNRGIGGVDSYGSNVIGKCHLIGEYTLTKSIDDTQFEKLQQYFTELSLKKALYSVIQFDSNTNVPNCVLNLDNNTGFYTEYIPSGAPVKKVLEQRKMVIAKYSASRNKLIYCRINTENKSQYYTKESISELELAKSDIFMLEPSYYAKGLNDGINKCKYQIYSYSDEAPIVPYHRVAAVDHPNAVIYNNRGFGGFKAPADFSSDDWIINNTYYNVGHRVIKIHREDLQDYNNILLKTSSGYQEYMLLIFDKDGNALVSHKLNSVNGYQYIPITSDMEYILMDDCKNKNQITLINCTPEDYQNAAEDYIEVPQEFIGVYQASVVNNALRSMTNQKVAMRKDLTDSFEVYATNRGNKYKALLFNHLNILGRHFILKYGTKDFSHTVGFNTLCDTTGTNDDLGMNDTYYKDGKVYFGGVERSCINVMGYESLFTGVPEQVFKTKHWYNDDNGILTDFSGWQIASYNGSVGANSTNPRFIKDFVNGKHMIILGSGEVTSSEFGCRSASLQTHNNTNYAPNAYGGSEEIFAGFMGVRNSADLEDNYTTRLCYEGPSEEVDVETYKSILN